MLRCAPSKQLRISGLVLTLSLIAAALVFVSAPDGDTLTVRNGNVKTIARLAEIDAPERTQPYSPGEQAQSHRTVQRREGDRD